MASIKAIRGMHDILPDQTPLWQFFEAKVKSVFDQYGYQEIRMPIAEKTDLFCRSIGEATDVVEKEMYILSYMRLNEVVREVSASRKVDLIDLANLIPSSSLYMYDHVHLNENGSKLAAKIMTDYWNQKN